MSEVKVDSISNGSTKFVSKDSGRPLNLSSDLDTNQAVDATNEGTSSDQSFVDLLKKFRSQSAGIISEFRRKSAYIPESVRRAEKQAKARSRNRKKMK